MKEIDFIGKLHNSTQRDYLGRVNDPDYPKEKAAKLAKKFDFDYWDGDRRICYGGYKYIEGRWEQVARAMAQHYNLPDKARILDVGCGKGYLLYDFLKVLPNIEIFGNKGSLISDNAVIRISLNLASIVAFGKLGKSPATSPKNTILYGWFKFL